MSNLAQPAPSPVRAWVERFLHVIAEPRSYLNAAYMATALPFGLFYFAIIIGGASVGAALSVFGVGLLILLGCLATAWGLALFEREVVVALIGVDMPPLSLPDPEILSAWRRLVRHLRRATTWRSLAFLLVKFPFGIFATLLTAAMLVPSLAMILGPVGFLFQRGPVPEAIGLLIFPGLPGVFALALSLHVLNRVGRAWGGFAAEMLGVGEEERLIWEARRRAEAADRSRRELIMNVSHELRTPITTIQAHVDSLLLPQAERPAAEEVERRLQVTAAETRRLADLVEDLLMLARADSEELKVTVRAVELAPLMDLVALSLAPLARSQRQVSVNRAEGAAGLWATADPDRLTQVLTNLVRNAVNYTPEGGVVSLRAADGGPQHAVISVSDTGSGIPPEELERIFDRFYRTDASRTRNTGGFGLGLSIVRELVEAMGGSVHATSKVGFGSTFWISLRKTAQEG
ncbi:MAG: ATP-binding protein [Candidatus Dormibacterales bacterium]